MQNSNILVQLHINIPCHLEFKGNLTNAAISQSCASCILFHLKGLALLVADIELRQPVKQTKEQSCLLTPQLLKQNEHFCAPCSNQL